MNATLKRCSLILALWTACASLPAAADHGGFHGGGGGGGGGGYSHGGGYEGRGGWGGGYEGGWGWGGLGLGLGFGAAYLANPYVYSPYYGYPYAYPYAYPYGYASPTVVIESPAPPVSPQGTTVTAPPAQASGSWFYCDSAKGYYPYVAQCPEPWRRVSATPPGAVQ